MAWTNKSGSPGTAKSRLDPTLYPSTAGPYGASSSTTGTVQNPTAGTDEWLQGVLGKTGRDPTGTSMAPRTGNGAVRSDYMTSTRPHDPMKRDGWCSSCPCCLTEDSCCTECGCGRCFLTVINIIFTIVGAGCIAGAIYFKNNSDVINVCDWCKDMDYGVLGLGALILLLSIAGYLVACRGQGNKCCGTIYVVFMFILFLVGAALTAITVMIKTSAASGFVTDKLRDGWESAVKDSPEKVCEVQDQLKCSGFDICCYPGCTGYNASQPPKGCPKCSTTEAPAAQHHGKTPPPTPKPTPPHPHPSNHTPPPPTDLIVGGTTRRAQVTSSGNQFDTPCHQKLKDSINDYFPGLIAGTGGFTLLSFIGMILTCSACCGSKRRQGYEAVATAY